MFGKFDQMVWKTRNNQNNKIFGLTLSNTNNTFTVSGNVTFQEAIKSDGQEISTIEWQELKNRFPSFFVHK